MAELGATPLDCAVRGAELKLHGTMQLGPYQESRGFVLRNAMRHLSDAGLGWTVLHDRDRTAQLQTRVAEYDPESTFRFYSDLGIEAARSLSIQGDFDDDARVLLVEAQHAARSLPIHILVARREAGKFYVMNTATGGDHEYEPAHIAMHVASPVRAGAIAFAGRQYLYTGVAIRVCGGTAR